MKVLTHWTLAFVTVILVTLFHYNNNYIVETARLKLAIEIALSPLNENKLISFPKNFRSK